MRFLVVIAILAALPEAAWAALGTVRISSEPENGEVVFGGQPVGSTPMTLTVPEGSHTITIRKHGFEDSTAVVEVRSAMVAEVQIRLNRLGSAPGASGDPGVWSSRPTPAAGAAEGGGRGSIAIQHPAGAVVLVNGSQVFDEHRQPVLVPITLPELPAGTHALTLAVAGMPPLDLEVPVRAGAETRVDASSFERFKVPTGGSAGRPVSMPPPLSAPPAASIPLPPGAMAPIPGSGGALGVPIDVRVSSADGAGRVKIEWSSVTGASAFNVYKSESPEGPWTRTNGDFPIPVTTLLLSGHEPGRRYWFRVSAVASSGLESDPSTPVPTP